MDSHLCRNDFSGKSAAIPAEPVAPKAGSGNSCGLDSDTDMRNPGLARDDVRTAARPRMYV